MTPYYSDDLVTIYHGRCEEIIPEIVGGVSVIVTDPPYGIAWDVRGGIGPKSRSASRARRGALFPSIEGDDQPFDPAPLLALGLPTVMFGANHYSERLPASPSWLIWDKRGRNHWHSDQGDAELAWSNLGGPIRVFRQIDNGGRGRAEDRGIGGYRPHPTMKPVGVMRWIVGRCPDGLVLDPYMGSGSTIIAAKSLGRAAIGIEIVERYCEEAARRCSQEVLGLA